MTNLTSSIGVRFEIPVLIITWRVASHCAHLSNMRLNSMESLGHEPASTGTEIEIGAAHILCIVVLLLKQCTSILDDLICSPSAATDKYPVTSTKKYQQVMIFCGGANEGSPRKGSVEFAGNERVEVLAGVNEMVAHVPPPHREKRVHPMMEVCTTVFERPGVECEAVV